MTRRSPYREIAGATMARFATPPDRHAFHQSVWDAVRQIPAGLVSTYGWIATLADPPAGLDAAAYRAFGARWVGGALAHCPDDVPWWRVINAQGRISARDGAIRQRERLESEGIAFDEHGRVALARFGWRGDSQ
jgi:methylated-DNA-protein-cysteine methyltransferase-like protein